MESNQSKRRWPRWVKALIILNIVAYLAMAITTFLFAGTIVAIFADDTTARELGFAGSAALALCSPVCPLAIVDIFGGIMFWILKGFFGDDDTPSIFKTKRP